MKDQGSFKKQLITTFKNLKKRKVAWASLILAFGLLIGKLAGLIKLRMFAHYFGIGPALDVFFAATTIADVWAQILITGVIYMVLVPFFSKLAKKRKDLLEGVVAVNTLFVLITLIIWGLGVLLVTLGTQVLIESLSHFNVSVALTSADLKTYQGWFISVFRLSFIPVIFLVTTNVWAMFLHSLRKFTVPSLITLIFNVGTVVALFVFHRYHISEGPIMIINSVIFGAFITAVLIVIYSVKQYKASSSVFLKGIKLAFSRDFFEDIIDLFRASIVRFTEFLTSQLGYMFSVFWLVNLGSGILSGYKYAETLRLLFLQIFVLSAAQALFPYISDLAVKNEGKQVFEKTIKLLKITLLLALSVGIFYMLFADLIVSLLFDGNLSLKAKTYISTILVFSVLLMVAQATIIPLKRVVYAYNKGKYALYSEIIAMVFRVFLGVALTILILSRTGLNHVAAGYYMLAVGVGYSVASVFLLYKVLKLTKW